MALKAVLDTLDGLDPILQKEYVKGEDGKFRLDAEGVEDVSGLKSALKKERDNGEALKKALKQFDGISDPEEVRKILSRIANDEEARMIAEGKSDVVIARRMEALRKEHEKSVKEALERADKAEARAKKLSSKTLNSALRAAAAEVGTHDKAFDDFAARAQRDGWTIDEEGELVALTEEGKPRLGKDGKTTMSLKEWGQGLRETAAHLFPATGSGTGGPGTKTGAGDGAKQMKRTDFNRLDPYAQAAKMKEGVSLVD